MYEPPRRGDYNNNNDFRYVRFGGYFAPNVSWMKPTANKSDDGLYRISSQGSMVGYTWGMLIDYAFTENYGIATGVQVNNTGGSITAERRDKVTTANPVNSANFKYYLQYLEVPFNLKLKSDELSVTGLKFFGQIGLTAGVNINKKVTYSVLATDELGSERQYSADKEKLYGSFTITPFLLQLNVGGGLEKPFTDRLSGYFGFFFNNGFVPDVTNPKEYKLDYSGKFNDGSIRLNSFAFRFGLFF